MKAAEGLECCSKEEALNTLERFVNLYIIDRNLLKTLLNIYYFKFHHSFSNLYII